MNTKEEQFFKPNQEDLDKLREVPFRALYHFRILGKVTISDLVKKGWTISKGINIEIDSNDNIVAIFNDNKAIDFEHNNIAIVNTPKDFPFTGNAYVVLECNDKATGYEDIYVTYILPTGGYCSGGDSLFCLSKEAFYHYKPFINAMNVLYWCFSSYDTTTIGILPSDALDEVFFKWWQWLSYSGNEYSSQKGVDNEFFKALYEQIAEVEKVFHTIV